MAVSDLPLEDLLMDGLSDDKARTRPRDLNSIAWLLWHMARTEDVAMNLVVADRPQVLREQEWLRRLNVARGDIGTGMTSEEVSELSATIDVPALRGYRAAVGQRTREIVGALPVERLADNVGALQLSRLQEEGALGANGAWLAGVWDGRPKEFFVTFTSIAHSYAQLGEAFVLRGLLGLVNP